MKAFPERSELLREKLFELRTEKELSQVKLVEDLKANYPDEETKSLRSIQSFERDRDAAMGMGLRFLSILADYYNVSSDYLLGLSEDPGREPIATKDLKISRKAIENLIFIASYENPDVATLFSRLLEMDDLRLVFVWLAKALQHYKYNVGNRIQASPYQQLPEELKEECRKYDVEILSHRDAADHYRNAATDLLNLIFDRIISQQAASDFKKNI